MSHEGGAKTYGTRHQSGEEHAVDVTMDVTMDDAEHYQEWYEHEELPAVKEKIP